MKITIEGRGPKQGQRMELDMRTPALPANEPEGSVLYWARLKGHVPGPAGQFRGDFHRGPHVRVIARHMRWPLNRIVGEAEYDAAAVSAYAVRLGENIAEQDAALKAANARAGFDAALLAAPAGQTISIADDGEEVTS